MKKILAVFMMCMVVFGLTACGGEEEKREESANANATQATEVSTESGTEDEVSSDNEGGQSGKSLIVYFSATGNTKAVAEIFAEEKNWDIYEIVPEQPYTDADLDYNDSSSRSTVEQNDESPPCHFGKYREYRGFRCDLCGISNMVGRYAPHSIYLL